MANILIYAHSTSLCRKVLSGLNIPEQNKIFIGSKGSLSSLIERMNTSKPDYVVGLGNYGGNAKQIRIEAKCDSIFRRRFLGGKFVEYEINYFFLENEYFKISKTIGTSYCNMSSYHVMKSINDNKLKSKYTFLHIPKKFNFELAIKVINDQLSSL